MKITPWRIIGALGLTAAGIGILVLIVNNNNAGQRDFIQYWASGQQLIHGANPYDDAAIQVLERTAGYDLNYHLTMRNPPVALFLALPLGLVGPNTGLVLWLLALLASLVASIRMLWTLHGRPPDGLHLLGYCFAPVMECLMAGQLGIFLLLGVVLFLYFHKSQPFLAGAALLLCAAKPHLFLPFGIVLLLWVVVQKEYRILAGFCAALLAGCTLASSLDPHVWSQYSQMMRTAGALNEPVPVLSVIFRVLVDINAVWLQFLPEAAGCAWALWYFWTRRKHWSWTDQGLLLLLVSALCRPFGWFSDEAILLPAVLAGIYRADDSGRSLLPFGFIAGVAMIEVFVKIPMTSMFYLWTVPAWLAWYLYATGNKSIRAKEAHSGAAGIAEPR
jgi:hypothetical protein